MRKYIYFVFVSLLIASEVSSFDGVNGDKFLYTKILLLIYFNRSYHECMISRPQSPLRLSKGRIRSINSRKWIWFYFRSQDLYNSQEHWHRPIVNSQAIWYYSFLYLHLSNIVKDQYLSNPNDETNAINFIAPSL